eukprot:16397-Heterococcus_DN1.PRE.1
MQPNVQPNDLSRPQGCSAARGTESSEKFKARICQGLAVEQLKSCSASVPCADEALLMLDASSKLTLSLQQLQFQSTTEFVGSG